MSCLRFSAKVFSIVLLIGVLALGLACAPSAEAPSAKIVVMLGSWAGPYGELVSEEPIDSIEAGQPLFVGGSGFTPGDAVDVVLVGALKEKFGDPVAGAAFDKYYPDYLLGNASVKADGSFMTIPGGLVLGHMVGSIPADLEPGSYVVKATDHYGIEATYTLTVKAPAK